MKVGLRPKKFFQDIVVIPRSEMERARLEIEEHKGKKQTQSPKPLVFDTILPEDHIKKRITELWQKEKKAEKQAFSARRINSLEEVAERALGQKTAVAPTSSFRVRPKTLFKNSLTLFLKFSLVAVMIYNAVSLYYDKNWLSEKLNNLALASKTHFALAQESLVNLDRTKSSNEIEKAGLNLLQIKAELLNQGEYSYILPSHPLLNNELTRGQNMLELGLLIKETNSDFNAVLDDLMGNSEDKNLWQKTQELKPAISRIEDRINKADIILKSDQDLKQALGVETGGKIENIIAKSRVELDKISQAMDVVPLVLGKNGDNHYLILFLNNAEMRAGGGFPGNYGQLSLADNNLKEIKIDDIYQLNWLKKAEVERLNTAAESSLEARKQMAEISPAYPQPVETLAKNMDINRYWLMPYCNWNLDFRDNAKRAENLFQNFYQQGEVAGVIALTPDLIENILSLIGPIKMDDYGVEINQDNFREVMEYKVEVDNPFKKENRREINPKQIITDFGPKLLAKISQADLGQKIKLVKIILDGVKDKQLLLYHQDPKVEKIISDFGASGEVKNPAGDFLGIAQVNLNSMKNGRVIDVRANFESEVKNLGFALDELSLTAVNNESNPRFLHGQEASYYQILVPLGSRIREAKIDGQDITGQIDYFTEAEHTIFGFKLSLEPGEAKNIVLKYQAPLKSESGYSLNLFKQAGAKAMEFRGEINFEDNAKYGPEPKIIREAIDADKTIEF